MFLVEVAEGDKLEVRSLGARWSMRENQKVYS